ncbi:MAG: hypothetical protein V3S85_01715, partial [Nitrospirales bacterium]
IAPLEQFFYPSPQGDAGQPRPPIRWGDEIFTFTFGQGLSSIPTRFLPDGKPKKLALWDGFFKEADRVGNQPEGRVSAEPDRGRTFF